MTSNEPALPSKVKAIVAQLVEHADAWGWETHRGHFGFEIADDGTVRVTDHSTEPPTLYRLAVTATREPSNGPTPVPVDALEQRIDLIAALKDGWDGPGAIAPPASAVAAVRQALADIAPIDRVPIECGAHGDGYLALTIRCEQADDAWMADVHADRIEYEANGTAWVGPTDAGALAHELRIGLALARLTTP